MSSASGQYYEKWDFDYEELSDNSVDANKPSPANLHSVTMDPDPIQPIEEPYSFQRNGEFRFLSLPAEIRTMIYRFMVVDSVPLRTYGTIARSTDFLALCVSTVA